MRTLHRRYGAEVGDVVVGRVTEVGFNLVFQVLIFTVDANFDSGLLVADWR